MFQKIKNFIEKYERHISSVFMVGGFIMDNLALKRVDVLGTNIFLLSYILIAVSSIIFLNMYDAGRLKWKIWKSFHPWILFAMQFVIGGLFSSFFLFYCRSASLSASWPFLIVLFAGLLGNELVGKRYLRVVMQVSVLYLLLFSYLIFIVPVLVHEIGPRIFFLSGVVSLVAIGTLVHFLLLISKTKVKEQGKLIFISIGLIFLTINILYFTNIIPPIPLAVKDAGAYKYVARTQSGDYALVGDAPKVFGFFRGEQTLKLSTGDPVYVYSAIFAPADFSLRVFHVWSYFDVKKNKWVESAKIPLNISGGQGRGYRTYSMKENILPGSWRVDIETDTGQIIGRLKFTVEE